MRPARRYSRTNPTSARTAIQIETCSQRSAKAICGGDSARSCASSSQAHTAVPKDSVANSKLTQISRFCAQMNPYIKDIVRHADALMEKMTVAQLISSRLSLGVTVVILRYSTWRWAFATGQIGHNTPQSVPKKPLPLSAPPNTPILDPPCYHLRGPLVGGTAIQVMATSAAKAT